MPPRTPELSAAACRRARRAPRPSPRRDPHQATNGDTLLGGEDFDITLLNYLKDEFKKEQAIDLGQDKLAVQRLRGLQQVVASGARRLQQPGFGQRAPSGPQPAARSMVDKMVSVIGVWETSRLASAFFVWSRRV